MKRTYIVKETDVFGLEKTLILDKYQLRRLAKNYINASPIIWLNVMKASFKFKIQHITDGFFYIDIIPNVEF